MSLSVSRLTRWRGRRLLGAVLMFAYLAAFVALGWVHRHPAGQPGSSCDPDWTAAARSASAGITATTGASTEAAPCCVCAMVHGETTALAVAPVAIRVPTSAHSLPVFSIGSPPARSLPAASPRAPPLVA